MGNSFGGNGATVINIQSTCAWTVYRRLCFAQFKEIAGARNIGGGIGYNSIGANT